MSRDESSGAAATLARRVRRFLAARFDRKSELGLGLTASLLILIGAVSTFSGLLDAVLDNDALVRFDERAELWLRGHATAAGVRLFSDVTQLGDSVVVVVVVALALYLWRTRETLLLWTWLGANIGGKAIEWVLKTTVHRSRPQYAAAYLHGESYSFPSGHTMGATVCYLTLAYLLTTSQSWTGPRRAVAYGIAALIVLAVGFSRLYLGVHYPSDVFGGLVAGSAWIAACVAALRFAHSRHSARGATAA